MTSPLGSGFGQVSGIKSLVDDTIPGITPYVFAFLCDGFQAQEWQEYERIVRSFYERWREESPLDAVALSVRVYAFACESIDHGCSNDGARLPNQLKRTLFGFDAGTGPDDTFVAATIAQQTALYGIAPNCTPVLVNRSDGWGRSGGSVFYFSPYANGGAYDGNNTGLHEWGHSLGLADEYPGNAGLVYSGAEPSSPNITANQDRATCKWLSRTTNPASPWPSVVNPDAQTLTVVDPFPPSGVGLYEGGGYYYKGLFRPAMNCRMREERERWCPVCQAAIATAMKPYARSSVDSFGPFGIGALPAIANTDRWLNAGAVSSAALSIINGASLVVAGSGTVRGLVVSLHFVSVDTLTVWPQRNGSDVGPSLVLYPGTLHGSLEFVQAVTAGDELSFRIRQSATDSTAVQLRAEFMLFT
jgi:hypothetical protein